MDNGNGGWLDSNQAESGGRDRSRSWSNNEEGFEGELLHRTSTTSPTDNNYVELIMIFG